MTVLGINAYHGDVSAALVVDGRLVVAVEEERYRRVKHWAGFPEEAIRSCLGIAGVRPREIKAVAISRDPTANLARKAIFAVCSPPGIRLVRDRVRNAGRVRNVAGWLSDVLEPGSRRGCTSHR